MSIIYDALKKTQKERELASRVLNDKQFNYFDISLISLIVLLLLFLSYAYFTRYVIHTPFISKPITKAEPIIKSQVPPPVVSLTSQQLSEFKNTHHLNGIFISESERVVLINNQTYHVGDVIDNLKILAIAEDTVKLQDGEQTFNLQTF